MNIDNFDRDRLGSQLEKLRKDIKNHNDRYGACLSYSPILNEKHQKLIEQKHLSNTLKKSGLDAKELEAQDKEEVQILLKNLEEFRKQSPPEGIGNHREQERIISNIAAKEAGANTWLYPPAYACEPPGIAGCVAPLAELNMKVYSTGLGGGWGLWAHGTPGVRWQGLWFLYWPTVNGRLYVYPYVDIQGTVYIYAHDHWYTSTQARLTLTLWCNIYQFYWDNWTSIKVVDEYHTDSGASYWVDDYFVPGNSTTVVRGNPVWIYIEADLWAYGRSDHALAEGDFFSGAEKFIRIPQIWVQLVPF